MNVRDISTNISIFCAESIIHKHLQYRKTMGPLTVELRAKLHAFKLHV